MKKVIEIAHLTYLDQNDILGLIIGGPADTKDEFYGHENLDSRLKKILVKQIRTGEIPTNPENLAIKIVEETLDLLVTSEFIKSKEAIIEFLGEIRTIENSKAVYGQKDLDYSLNYSLLEKLIIVFDKEDESGKMKKIITKAQEKCEKTGTELIIIDKSNRFGKLMSEKIEIIENFGGIVGLKWF